MSDRTATFENWRVVETCPDFVRGVTIELLRHPDAPPDPSELQQPHWLRNGGRFQALLVWREADSPDTFVTNLGAMVRITRMKV